MKGIEKVGFTGSRREMRPVQWNKTKDILSLFENMKEFHHGDCIGCDAQAHILISKLFPDVKIHIHPPKTETYRAWCPTNIMHTPEEYIKRNHTIVDEVEIVVATPKEEQEQQRSGTWSTIRYAQKTKKPLYIIYPNGIFEYQEGKK